MFNIVNSIHTKISQLRKLHRTHIILNISPNATKIALHTNTMQCVLRRRFSDRKLETHTTPHPFKAVSYIGFTSSGLHHGSHGSVSIGRNVFTALILLTSIFLLITIISRSFFGTSHRNPQNQNTTSHEYN